MVDVTQAVQIARDYAVGILGRPDASLEEIERESYRDREVWKITLGFSWGTYLDAGRAALGLSSKEYKSFLIDAETGEPLAMRIREFTAG
jgi:hypothetical protein